MFLKRALNSNTTAAGLREEAGGAGEWLPLCTGTQGEHPGERTGAQSSGVRTEPGGRTSPQSRAQTPHLARGTGAPLPPENQGCPFPL